MAPPVSGGIDPDRASAPCPDPRRSPSGGPGGRGLPPAPSPSWQAVRRALRDRLTRRPARLVGTLGPSAGRFLTGLFLTSFQYTHLGCLQAVSPTTLPRPTERSPTGAPGGCPGTPDGVCPTVKSRPSSAQGPSFGALLRVHPSVAASKPTNRGSSGPHLLCTDRWVGGIGQSSGLFPSRPGHLSVRVPHPGHPKPSRSEFMMDR